MVRKLGANAPNNDTQKCRLIEGLRYPEAQKHLSLRRPTNLVATKQEATNWEEV